MEFRSKKLHSSFNENRKSGLPPEQKVQVPLILEQKHSSIMNEIGKSFTDILKPRMQQKQLTSSNSIMNMVSKLTTPRLSNEIVKPPKPDNNQDKVMI